MKNGIKTLAMWLIIGIIFIVVLSSIVENSDSKLKYSDLIADINSGKVESIQVESDGKKATVQLKDEKIRKEVGKGMNLRYTPEVIFKRDDSIERGVNMSKLINDLHIEKED